MPAVSISKVHRSYPEFFPYDADEGYPEYRGNVNPHVPNAVYRAVRETFELLQYDKENFGTPEWNPFGHFINPGNSVFIKPNLVTHEYGRKKDNRKGDLFSVITHPSVVRAVADYAAIALKGQGEIIIGDNPSIDANFSKLMEVTALDKFPEIYRQVFGVKCTVLDLREQWCDDLAYYGYQNKMKPLPGDPRGDSVINLGKKSFFYGMNPLLYRGVFTNRWETIRHHHGEVQEYSISNSIYQADVYISIPKLKTHHKVGATLNIKGLVGTCAKKNYLIHWRIGFPKWGGDEYPNDKNCKDNLVLLGKHLLNTAAPEKLNRWVNQRLKRSSLDKILQVPPYRGAWEGNDTCWRMAADLYQVLMSRERKSFTVIDGVIAGEQDGPFCPEAKEAGVIISGEDLIITDCVAVRLMDFDINGIKYLAQLKEKLNIDLNKVEIRARELEVTDLFDNKNNRTYLRFQPPHGWQNLRRKEQKS